MPTNYRVHFVDGPMGGRTINLALYDAAAMTKYAPRVRCLSESGHIDAFHVYDLDKIDEVDRTLTYVYM